MSHRAIPSILIVSAVALGAGCGGGDTNKSAPLVTTEQPAQVATEAAATTVAPSPSAMPAATSTPQPAPTEDPIALAAGQYSAKIADYNLCAARFNGAIESLAPDAEPDAVVPVVRELLTCTESFQAALYQIPFPPSLTAQASDMAAAVHACIIAWQAFIDSPSVAMYQAAVQAEEAASSASAAIRIALHLPPPPSEEP